MRLFLCLFALMAAGIALVAVPEPLLKLSRPGYPGIYPLWYQAVASFGLPMSLMMLRLTRRSIITLACFGWGMWLVLLSVPLLIASRELIPSSTFYGKILVAFVLVSALGTVIFSLVGLSIQRSKMNKVGAKA